MKSLICLIIISISIFQGLGNDVLFAKFHQNDYKIKDYRLEMKSFDKDKYYFFEAKTFKFNRSTAAANLTLRPKHDIDGKKFEIVVQAYKFASNEYRTFPIHLQLNMWKTFSSNIGGFQTVFKCGNLSMEPFTFKKGVIYHTCNIVMDASHLPPYIPVGRYMLEVALYVEEVQYAIILVFFEVYHEIFVKN